MTSAAIDRLETAAYVIAFCTQLDTARVVRGHFQRAFVVTA